jgi:serine/threonine protein kinase
MKAYGHNQIYNILVMELLGPSLDTLFYYNNDKFSLKTSCMIGLQILDRIEYVHSRRIIHCDIKPGNFAIGRDDNKSHIIYIIDFGFAKKFWNPTTKCHIPFIKGKRLTGTAKYSSINTLSGYEPSRRDDLESIAYLIIYFIKGRLPWQGLRHTNKEERNRKILEKKKNISSQELCSGCPKELEIFIDYIKNLGFTEVPDYDYLRQLIKIIMTKNNMSLDYYFDWDEEDPNISKDDIIYKNNYHIEYNGKKEWLIRNNDIAHEQISKEKNDINICTKLVSLRHRVPYYRNGGKNSSVNFNLAGYKTFSSSYNDLRINSAKYVSCRKNSIICK